MNQLEREHLDVALQLWAQHRKSHPYDAPDPGCVYCDDRLVDAYVKDGVIYTKGEDD